ncbi:MAG TPA: HAD-IB family hydrolase [Polyangiaceae bacterium]|nr:HAD-IB family hydrolase [Polyangiaceae bacterium]
MDRTLVRRDTASLWMRFQRDSGEAGFRDAVRVAWWLLQYSFGVVDVQRVAEQALADYRGESERRMEERCRIWFRDYVVPHVADAGRRMVRFHQDRGDEVAIVTSATRFAAEPLAEALGIERIAYTPLEVDERGCFTGRVDGSLCYGAEKVRYAEQLLEQTTTSLDEAVFYSDSITDLPLLERVAEPVVVNPDARLRRVARRRGWRIERW